MKSRKNRLKVKSNPCCVCGYPPGNQLNPVDPCHVRSFKVTQSDHPNGMIPMCRIHHDRQHKVGWAHFFRLYPNVKVILMKMGWEISEHPFQKGKLIFAHPEIC